MSLDCESSDTSMSEFPAFIGQAMIRKDPTGAKIVLKPGFEQRIHTYAKERGYTQNDADDVIALAREIFRGICANSPKRRKKIRYVDVETRLIDRLRIAKRHHVAPQDREDNARDTRRGEFRKYADTHPIEPIDETAKRVTDWPDPLEFER